MPAELDSADGASSTSIVFAEGSFGEEREREKQSPLHSEVAAFSERGILSLHLLSPLSSVFLLHYPSL